MNLQGELDEIGNVNKEQYLAYVKCLIYIKTIRSQCAKVRYVFMAERNNHLLTELYSLYCKKKMLRTVSMRKDIK